MIEIYVSFITAVIAPTILFILQTIRDKRNRMLHDNNLKLLRLEILMNLYHNPEDKKTILKLYDEYRGKGGNSYIQDRIKSWQDHKLRRCGH